MMVVILFDTIDIEGPAILRVARRLKSAMTLAVVVYNPDVFILNAAGESDLPHGRRSGQGRAATTRPATSKFVTR